jgi:hypothetical protein
LGHSVTITKVDPNHGAFVAHALHPTGEGNFLLNMGEAEVAARMGSKHGYFFAKLRKERDGWGGREG